MTGVVVWVSLGRGRLWTCADSSGDERFGDKVLESSPSKRFHELPLFDRAAPQVVPSSSLLFLVAALDVTLMLCEKRQGVLLLLSLPSDNAQHELQRLVTLIKHSRKKKKTTGNKAIELCTKHRKHIF